MSKQYTFEWNWKERFKDWTWYFAVLVALGPILLTAILEPNWLARFVGLSLFFVGVPIVGLWFAFGPRKNLGSEGRTIWPEYITKRFGDRVYLGTRILILGLVITMIFLLSLNYLRDAVLVISGVAPLSRVGEVTYAKNSLFISEKITLDGHSPYAPGHSFNALYLPLRLIQVGSSYEFLYLPNSEIILDARPVFDSQ